MSWRPRWLRRRRYRRALLYPCACRCGRWLGWNDPWDGYHGPDGQAEPYLYEDIPIELRRPR